MSALAVLENLVIVAGYAVLAGYLAPRLQVRYTLTKITGAGFFFWCGPGTHGELLTHALTGRPLNATSLHMLVIHGLQAVCVTGFVWSLHREYINARTRHELWATPAAR